MFFNVCHSYVSAYADDKFPMYLSVFLSSLFYICSIRYAPVCLPVLYVFRVESSTCVYCVLPRVSLTRDGVWIGNRVYLIFKARNYKQR
jgi:hypothetical protein